MVADTLNEFDQDSRVCGTCLDDIYLAEEIKATGEVRKCDFCRKRRKTWDLLKATTRVHDVLNEHFVKGTYQYYDGDTSGDPLSDVVTEILGDDAEERVVPAILEVLTDYFNGDPRDGDEPYWEETENYETVPTGTSTSTPMTHGNISGMASNQDTDSSMMMREPSSPSSFRTSTSCAPGNGN